MNTNFLEPGDPRRLSLHAPFGAGDAFCPECDMPWPCDVELQRQVLADEHAKLIAREDDPLAPGGGDDDAKLGVHGGSLPRGAESATGEVAQDGKRLRLIPGLSLVDANELVRQLHRHHEPVQGHKFSIGAALGDRYVGAIIVGRPVARAYDDGFTAEATRCVTDGTKNACSMLYAAAWRAWRAMGGTRLITYTGTSEPGTSLVAAGFRVAHQTRERAQGWNTPSRPRKPKHQNAKTLWEVAQ